MENSHEISITQGFQQLLIDSSIIFKREKQTLVEELSNCRNDIICDCKQIECGYDENEYTLKKKV